MRVASDRRSDEPIDVSCEALPESAELICADEIYIGENSTPTLGNRLLCLTAFQNPEFYRAQSMRLPTYGKPRIIHCAEEHPLHLALPRGCLDEVRRVLQELKIKTVVRDERFGGIPLSVSFCGVLRPEQQAAAEAEAYRRDRRRDAMLKKNGYFVLRFLAEDAGKRLDHILDTILATLAHRREDLG